MKRENSDNLYTNSENSEIPTEVLRVYIYRGVNGGGGGGAIDPPDFGRIEGAVLLLASKF